MRRLLLILLAFALAAAVVSIVTLRPGRAVR
jgi:hypothetical protein